MTEENRISLKTFSSYVAVKGREKGVAIKPKREDMEEIADAERGKSWGESRGGAKKKK